MSTQTISRFGAYWQLMRLDRPIGTFLLLWPTLWSLWIAAKGVPRWDVLLIFIAGTFLMRAAGCVINDFADRDLDGHVERTKNRPLATKQISTTGAVILFVVLCLAAFSLVLQTNELTIKLSFGGVVLAFCYPFMKRFTHLPQLVLGMAFSWGILMAFTAQAGELPQAVWLIYIANLLWTVAYDTFYAMVDRNDDLKVGIKSTAILFGQQDRLITAFLQILVLVALVMVGQQFELQWPFYAGLAAGSLLFIYQQILIRHRQRAQCFKAFLNNNWFGLVVFIGVATSFIV